MFARHTRTRMRPSSIAQGLKSWASKLHPQLPLTNQESSRLLNALTSAFRQKLDEAHPSNTKDHPKQDLSSKTVQKSASAFHSSAAHADKHLETVLTNPLLGGRILDYGTAKVELTRNPHRDPIEVLERYHEQGAASVAIAELVLSHFKHSLERLSQSKQDSLIEKTQAGRRVFKWLLESNLYDSKSYVDNLMFIEHLVFFLVKEGREANIWSWVKLDIGNLDDAPVNAARSIEKATRKTNLYKYRWRGRVLRALVSTKMGLLHAAGRSPSPEEINDGFDTISKICELKRSVAQSDHLYWIPMAPISTLLGRILARDMHRIRSELEVTKFDTLYDFMPVICDQAPPILLELERAKLLMIHPKGRQPDKAFNCFKNLFADNPSDDASRFISSIRSGGNAAAIHNWWAFATAVVYALRLQGSLEEADWLQARCIKEFPRQAPNFESKMQEYRRHDMSRGARLEQRAPEVQDRTRIPFPTFA